MCEGLGVISTVGGLVLLVPHLGVMGAALSTVTYVIVYILLRRSVARHAAAFLSAPTGAIAGLKPKDA